MESTETYSKRYYTDEHGRPGSIPRRQFPTADARYLLRRDRRRPMADDVASLVQK